MKTGFPKITIVTPSFRNQHTLEMTLQSVLSQNYPNLEYIVIDGHGDESHKIIERYESRLAYWVSEPDDGQYDAIEKGFQRGTGDIFYWINADDILVPRSLFVVAEIFREFENIEWLTTLRPGHWDASGYCSNFGTVSGFSKSAFLDGFLLPGTRSCGHWIQQESTFFRSSLWRKVGGRFPKFGLAGDFALWCEMYKHTNLYGCQYPLAGFRTIKGQRSEQIDEYLTQAKTALDSLREELNWSPGSLRSLLASSKIARRLPGGRNLARALGYEGFKVFNKDVRETPANWAIKRYRWLPGIR